MTLSLKKCRLFESFIDRNYCPICGSKLYFDNQSDSIYVSCNNDFKHFEVSGFKDLGSEDLILLYLNDYNEGIVNTTILKEFQNIIYRKLYGSH